MKDDFLNEQTATAPATQPRQLLRLHRRLFLLVFAVAVLWQGLFFVEKRLGQYHQDMFDSFKIILTVPGRTDNAALAQIGESLNQKEDVESVQLFSPQDGLQVVRRQNPQLAESLLLMGKDKMPAYFEVKVTPQTLGNIRPFVANLAAEYTQLTPHYNAAHGELVFYTGVCLKLLRVLLAVAALSFLGFMFLVEAYPSKETRSHVWSGALSGLLAALLSCAVVAVAVYPTGLLQQAVADFTSIERQLLIAVFCTLLGWTLSKWQKF